MAIRVTCPGCHKRFKVSDQFAGKSGPCPNCKTTIRVPTKDEEVKLHEPEGLGAGVRGAMVTKPLFREDAKFRPAVFLAISAGALVVLMVTAILGRADFFAEHALWKSALGLLLVFPPLVMGGYWFLRDEEEIERFRGRDLYLRTGVCSLLYLILWGVYGYLVGGGWLTRDSYLGLLIVFGSWLLGGGAVGMLCLEMDYGRGFFHHAFCLFVTALLRAVAGMGWVWEIPETLEPWEVDSLAFCLVAVCPATVSPCVYSVLTWCGLRRPPFRRAEDASHRASENQGPP